MLKLHICTHMRAYIHSYIREHVFIVTFWTSVDGMYAGTSTSSTRTALELFVATPLSRHNGFQCSSSRWRADSCIRQKVRCSLTVKYNMLSNARINMHTYVNMFSKLGAVGPQWIACMQAPARSLSVTTPAYINLNWPVVWWSNVLGWSMHIHTYIHTRACIHKLAQFGPDDVSVAAYVNEM